MVVKPLDCSALAVVDDWEEVSSLMGGAFSAVLEVEGVGDNFARLSRTDPRYRLLLATSRELLERTAASGRSMVMQGAQRFIARGLQRAGKTLLLNASVVRSRFCDDGLFTNVLGLIDAHLFAPPGARIVPRWRRTGGQVRARFVSLPLLCAP